MWCMLKQLLISCLIVSCYTIHGQNAPVTSVGTVSNAVPGQNITVPVTVTGFNNIGSANLTLDYDFQKIHFVSSIKNPLLSGTFSVGDNDLGNGMHRLILGWYGPATSLPDGSVIVSYEFYYIIGSSSLQWFDIGPSCEYTDANATVLNDLPTPAFYINGWICGAVSVPGPITGNDTVCQRQSGEIYRIDPLLLVTGYCWSVPTGSIITSGSNTNIITVDFTASSVSGNIEVSGANECGNGPVTVLPLTVFNLPERPQITLSGQSLISNVATGNQWYREMEIIPGATGQYYVPEENGKYYDVVTENGCSSDSSNNIEFTIIQIKENPPNAFQIFPNPADDHIIIRTSGPPDLPFTLILFSSYGRFLRKYEITGGPFLKEYRIETKNLPRGVYFIKIEKINKTSVYKIILI